MGLPPLSKIPLILRPQAWLHRRHYGEVLSPIRWWGRIPFIFLSGVDVCWLAGAQTLTARSGSTIACQRAHCANVPV